jgi:DNA-directed RNA polymerase subunit RPC12/RpoP
MGHQATTREETTMWLYTCAECGEGFAISDPVVRGQTRLILCPCCGNTDVAVEPPVTDRDAA